MVIESVLAAFLFINSILEIISIIFITFVFFDLVFVDRIASLSDLSEKFEKFKRYDIFKSSLIYLVLSLYFSFFAKLSHYLAFPDIAFQLFTFFGNVALVLFVFKLYKLIHQYVPNVSGSRNSAK